MGLGLKVVHLQAFLIRVVLSAHVEIIDLMTGEWVTRVTIEVGFRV